MVSGNFMGEWELLKLWAAMVRCGRRFIPRAFMTAVQGRGAA